MLSQLVVRGLNHVIAHEQWALERLRVHSGAKIQLDGGLASLKLSIDETGLFILGDGGATANVTLTFPSDIIIRILFDYERLFSFVKIAGSVDVAETLAFVFRHVNWDMEADLATVIGDIAAHRMVTGGRSLAIMLAQSIRRLRDNVSEYVFEDSSMLPANREVRMFAGEVNCLRDGVDRLEKRILKLS